MGSFIIPLYTLILTQKIGMSKPDTGWMTALLTLVQSVCLLIGGKFIDKIGRKKVLCFCQITGAALYFVCVFLPTNFLLAGVIMITAGLYMTAAPAQDALLADYTKEIKIPPETRLCGCFRTVLCYILLLSVKLSVLQKPGT